MNSMAERPKYSAEVLDHHRSTGSPHGFCIHGELPGDCDKVNAPDLRPGYVYVASSWRCAMQPAVIQMLKVAGISHYDFRNPEGGTGFGWQEVMPSFDIDKQAADAQEYIAALDHPRSVEGFNSDFDAMKRADTFVLVLPCGRSAHLELGWAVGAGKRTAILLDPDVDTNEVTPELMYKMIDYVAPSVTDLLGWLGVGA